MATNNTHQSALFQSILENISTAVLVFDRDLKLSYINMAGEMLFSLGAQRAQGLALDSLLHESDNFISNIHQAILSNHPFTERELSFHIPLEHTIIADCTVTPMPEDTSNHAVIIELTPLDRQLRIAREENLLAQHSATRDVIRGMAHEIKNPLGGIRGAAQLLEGELDNAELKEYTGIIIHEADRLQNLLNRMLGPNTLPQKKDINIHELLEHIRQLVQSEVSSDINIIRDYDPSLPDAYADPDQLTQAVLNLVRNAAQSLGQSGNIILRTRIQRQLTIDHKRHKLVASIDVVDDGPGVDPAIVDKIFFPMITGRADGTGLGLPIAQALINQHDGLIECSSKPNQTIFTILLPLENNS